MKVLKFKTKILMVVVLALAMLPIASATMQTEFWINGQFLDSSGNPVADANIEVIVATGVNCGSGIIYNNTFTNATNIDGTFNLDIGVSPTISMDYNRLYYTCISADGDLKLIRRLRGGQGQIGSEDTYFENLTIYEDLSVMGELILDHPNNESKYIYFTNDLDIYAGWNYDDDAFEINSNGNDMIYTGNTFYPSENNSESLGYSVKRWGNIWGVNIYGDNYYGNGSALSGIITNPVGSDVWLYFDNSSTNGIGYNSTTGALETKGDYYMTDGELYLKDDQHIYLNGISASAGVLYDSALNQLILTSNGGDVVVSGGGFAVEEDQLIVFDIDGAQSNYISYNSGTGSTDFELYPLFPYDVAMNSGAYLSFDGTTQNNGIFMNGVTNPLELQANNSIYLNAPHTSTLDLIPQTNNTYDLGTPTLNWNDLFLGGAVSFESGTKNITYSNANQRFQFNAPIYSNGNIVGEGDLYLIGPTPNHIYGGDVAGDVLTIHANSVDTSPTLTLDGGAVKTTTIKATWTNASKVYNGIIFNVTNVASSGNSRFFETQVNGTTNFFVNKSGSLHSGGGYNQIGFNSDYPQVMMGKSGASGYGLIDVENTKPLYLNALKGGKVYIGSGGLYPDSNNTENIGSATERFNGIYGVSIRGTDYYAGDGSQGITNTASYWLCTNAACTTTCQVSIKDGLITGCA